MNRKFISKSNRVLRKVLNSKDNLDIIKDFIEAFLDIEINQIQLNPYLEKESQKFPSEEDFGIADIRVKLKNNEEMNIGIQFIDGYYIQSKLLLYYAQIHSGQLLFEDGREIAKTLTINLLDFEYLNSTDYFTKIIAPCNNKEKDTGTQVELYLIELQKFKFLSSFEEMTRREAWMFFLCGNDKQILAQVLEKFSEIKKLDGLLNQYWRNEKME